VKTQTSPAWTRITVPLPIDLAVRLAEFAGDTDRSLAATVRVALRRLLDDEGGVRSEKVGPGARRTALANTEDGP
jgi:hypothetical protein